MNDITVLGIDLAKNTLQLIGVDKHHKEVFKKRVSPQGLMTIATKLKPCVILMEACGTSNHWGRTLTKLGHEVKLISPQHVTPYVGHHKNDYKDTQGIIEAGTRPKTEFVAIKTLEQQDLQSINRLRDRLVSNRISLSNQIRGLLLEYGIVINKGMKPLTVKLVELLETSNEFISEVLKECLLDIYEEFKELSKRIERYSKKIELLCKRNEYCQLLQTIPGIGPIVASSLYAAVGNGSHYKNGRQMAASIGLVPKQYSSGDKQRLGGIIQMGNRILKALLIHGGRAVVNSAQNKTDKRSIWIQKLLLTKPYNVVSVAVANRIARMAWAILQSGTPYNATVGYAS
jgi:transposase